MATLHFSTVTPCAIMKNDFSSQDNLALIHVATSQTLRPLGKMSLTLSEFSLLAYTHRKTHL
jgi:hypothetical protein